MNIGDQFTGEVRDLTGKGKGVVNAPNGQAFFVSGTVPGDEGTFRIVELGKRYGFAELIELKTKSEGRIDPDCIYHGFSDQSCQGCPWLMMSYETQLEHKDKYLRYLLQRSNLITDLSSLAPIAPSPLIRNYRNRAQFKTDGSKLGYVAADKSIVDIADCAMLSSGSRQRLLDLRRTLPRDDWRPGDGYDWNFIDIDDQQSLESTRLNQRLPFRQANDHQNEFMKSWLKQQLRDSPVRDHRFEVLELFCGSGNFTKVIAECESVSRVLAVEASEQAIDDLDKLLIPKVEGMALDLFRISALNVIKKKVRSPRVLVLDPPRAGFRKLSQYTNEFRSLEFMVYISCDASTFSYDAHMIAKQGWTLRELQAVDQFPNTPHIEILATFVK